MDFQLIKLAANAVSGFGVGIIIGNIVDFTTPETVSVVKRLGIIAGKAALAGTILQPVNAYVGGIVDTMAEALTPPVNDSEEGDDVSGDD